MISFSTSNLHFPSFLDVLVDSFVELFEQQNIYAKFSTHNMDDDWFGLLEALVVDEYPKGIYYIKFNKIRYCL